MYTTHRVCICYRMFGRYTWKYLFWKGIKIMASRYPVPIPEDFALYGSKGSSFYHKTRACWILGYLGWKTDGDEEYKKNSFGFYVVEWFPNKSLKVLIPKFVNGHGWFKEDTVYGLWVWGINEVDDVRKLEVGPV